MEISYVNQKVFIYLAKGVDESTSTLDDAVQGVVSVQNDRHQFTHSFAAEHAVGALEDSSGDYICKPIVNDLRHGNEFHM